MADNKAVLGSIGGLGSGETGGDGEWGWLASDGDGGGGGRGEGDLFVIASNNALLGSGWVMSPPPVLLVGVEKDEVVAFKAVGSTGTGGGGRRLRVRLHLECMINQREINRNNRCWSKSVSLMPPNS